MLNVTKIKELAKANGITLAFICKALGKDRSYLNGVAFRKADLSDEDVEKIANILHTSVAYLRDETDEPGEKSIFAPSAKFGRVKEMTKANGLKLSYLCERLGVGRNYFVNAEKQGNDIPDAKLSAIADILHTSVAYLRGETDDPSKAESTEKEKSIANIANALEELPEDRLKELERLIYAFLGK